MTASDKTDTPVRRWPSAFMSSQTPNINPVWVAEYMREHNLSLEVAMEHMAVYLREFIRKLTKHVEKIEGSDQATLNQVKVFVDGYKPLEGYYSPIKLVRVIKEGTECPVKLKKPLLKDSPNSSKD